MLKGLIPKAMLPRHYRKNTFGYRVRAGLAAINFGRVALYEAKRFEFLCAGVKAEISTGSRKY